MTDDEADLRSPPGVRSWTTVLCLGVRNGSVGVFPNATSVLNSAGSVLNPVTVFLIISPEKRPNSLRNLPG